MIIFPALLLGSLIGGYMKLSEDSWESARLGFAVGFLFGMGLGMVLTCNY